MPKTIEAKNKLIKQYFSILSEEFPDFLKDYIDTKPMQRIGKIGCSCGCDYTKLFKNQFFYSNLEHSIGTALIIWHFTKDKKQTLAGLFHDIATPVFKHTIDFMNGDHEKQESTEELTTHMIKSSVEIRKLLERDQILVEEVDNYHQYPIADNDIPKLSADRLEYTFANAFYFKPIWNLADVKQMYDNIEIQTNEEGIQELGFKDIKIAEKFVKGASQMWPMWISSKGKVTMQFLTDTIQEMKNKHLITIEELYTLSEKEIIQKMKYCPDQHISHCFRQFQNLTEVHESNQPVENKYCIGVKTKRRYIIPLVQNIRIDKVSYQANEQINQFLQYEPKPYAYLDFK